MLTLGKLVHRLRSERGLTQTRLAELSGFDPGTISRIERDVGDATTRTMLAIWKALAARAPIGDVDVRKFADHTGLDPIALSRIAGEPEARPGAGNSDRTRSDAMRELDALERLLRQARTTSGDDVVRIVLEALARPRPPTPPRDQPDQVPQLRRPRPQPGGGSGYGVLHDDRDG